jgi:hypothetical protein
MRFDGLRLLHRSPYLFRLRPTFGQMRACLEECVVEGTHIPRTYTMQCCKALSAQLCSYFFQ